MGTRRTGLHHKREEKETSKMMLNGKSKVTMMTQAQRTAGTFWSKSEASRGDFFKQMEQIEEGNKFPKGNKYPGEEICTADRMSNGTLG